MHYASIVCVQAVWQLKETATEHRGDSNLLGYSANLSTSETKGLDHSGTLSLHSHIIEMMLFCVSQVCTPAQESS